MIKCTNCQHENLTGALFCSECGARLVANENLTTHAIKRTPSDTLTPEMAPPINAQMASPVSEVDTVISLLVTETGQVLHLAGRSEYTIGRISDGQPILPDVDLSTYDAFSQGVSRLHVSLKITKNGVVVTDLGSSNGTRVNGKKIIPHVEYPINHGDTLALGKFKFQILIHR